MFINQNLNHHTNRAICNQRLAALGSTDSSKKQCYYIRKQCRQKRQLQTADIGKSNTMSTSLNMSLSDDDVATPVNDYELVSIGSSSSLPSLDTGCSTDTDISGDIRFANQHNRLKYQHQHSRRRHNRNTTSIRVMRHANAQFRHFARPAQEIVHLPRKSILQCQINNIDPSIAQNELLVKPHILQDHIFQQKIIDEKKATDCTKPIATNSKKSLFSFNAQSAARSLMRLFTRSNSTAPTTTSSRTISTTTTQTTTRTCTSTITTKIISNIIPTDQQSKEQQSLSPLASSKSILDVAKGPAVQTVNAKSELPNVDINRQIVRKLDKKLAKSVQLNDYANSKKRLKRHKQQSNLGIRKKSFYSRIPFIASLLTDHAVNEFNEYINSAAVLTALSSKTLIRFVLYRTNDSSSSSGTTATASGSTLTNIYYGFTVSGYCPCHIGSVQKGILIMIPVIFVKK
jgi:hypothetical protein